MNDQEIILRVFVWIDDQIGELSLDPQPGPVGRLALSEVLSLMVLHHLLKPFWSLKSYCRWLAANWRHFFPHLVEYSRLTRLFNQAKEFLKNGVKLKIIRDRKHFLFCNRMLLERQAIQALYRLRWKIEAVFRVLKSGLGLSGCQQQSMRAQGIFVAGCLLLFSLLEIVSGGKPYSALASVISEEQKPETLIAEGFVMLP